MTSSSTSIVTESHNAGLEIYSFDFAKDKIILYNYNNYDQLAEMVVSLLIVYYHMSEYSAESEVGKLLSFTNAPYMLNSKLQYCY
jgi:glycerophosphoryl diester phosphodiesterase